MRHTKMAEWMENVEKSISRIMADKVYTSAEFKRERDNFHVSFFFTFFSLNDFVNLGGETCHLGCEDQKILRISVKVRQFQNEFMESSFLPKYERKIVKISALTTQGRNPQCIS